MESLIGRHLADVRFALYAGDEFARLIDGNNPLTFNKWISPDLTFSQMAVTKWVQSDEASDPCKLSSNSNLPDIHCEMPLAVD